MSDLDEDRAEASASMSDEGGVERLAIMSLQDQALIDMPVEDSGIGRPLLASQSPRKRPAHAPRNHVDPERMADDNEPSPAWDVCIDCFGPIGETRPVRSHLPPQPQPEYKGTASDRLIQQQLAFQSAIMRRSRERAKSRPRPQRLPRPQPRPQPLLQLLPPPLPLQQKRRTCVDCGLKFKNTNSLRAHRSKHAWGCKKRRRWAPERPNQQKRRSKSQHSAKRIAKAAAAAAVQKVAAESIDGGADDKLETAKKALEVAVTSGDAAAVAEAEGAVAAAEAKKQEAAARDAQPMSSYKRRLISSPPVKCKFCNLLLPNKWQLCLHQIQPKKDGGCERVPAQGRLVGSPAAENQLALVQPGASTKASVSNSEQIGTSSMVKNDIDVRWIVQRHIIRLEGIAR